MYVKEQILTLQAYKPGKPAEVVKREYGLETVVKLASNENPFGCSDKVKSAIHGLLTEMAVYPDGAAETLTKKVASFLGVKENQLIFGSGADEVIQMISRSLLTKEHNIVQASPTFSQYSHHAVIEGAEVREVPLKDGVHDVEGMLASCDEQTKIIWICNPNNPTGTYLPEKVLRDFLQKVPVTTFVVIDEAYFEYADAKDYPNSIKYVSEYPNVMVLRTFSKAYGLASLRIGYGVANEKVIEEMNIARLPFNTSSFAQVAAIAGLEDQVFIKECITKNKEGLKLYESFCQQQGISYYPSQANFIYMNLKDSYTIFEKLQSKGYIIRAFKEGIRITIGSKEENEGLLAQLKALLQAGVV